MQGYELFVSFVIATILLTAFDVAMFSFIGWMLKDINEKIDKLIKRRKDKDNEQH